MGDNEIIFPQLPQFWIWTTLGEVGNIITGNTPSKKVTKNYGDYIPFVKSPELKDCYIISSEDNLSEEGAKLARILPHESVLISCIGILGKTGINKIPVAFNQQINSVTFFNGVSPKFGFFYCQTLKKWLYSVASATTLPIVNKSKFIQAPFPLPPLPEQHRIVARIEQLFTNLDAGVESLKAARTQLKRYRQSVLKSACEGRLVPTEAELARAEGREYEPAEVLLERILEERRRKWDENYKGKKYKEPVVPDTSLWPELPEGWDWVAVEQLAQVGTGATPLKSKNEYYKNGSIPWITSGALNKLYISKPSDLVTEKALQETNLTLYPEHTLLVAMYGEGKTRGKCSELLIEATTNQAIAALVLEDTFSALRSFLKIFLVKNYDDTRRKSSGGVQPNLNLGLIKKIKIPLPPLAEQHRIVAEVERRLSVADEMEKTIEHSLKQAERLRQSILKRAFEGKLVPQDPEDEPARVLLERIRREKEIHEKNNKSKTRKNRGNKALTKAELERFREADKQAADYIEKVDASHKWAT